MQTHRGLCTGHWRIHSMTDTSVQHPTRERTGPFKRMARAPRWRESSVMNNKRDRDGHCSRARGDTYIIATTTKKKTGQNILTCGTPEVPLNKKHCQAKLRMSFIDANYTSKSYLHAKWVIVLQHRKDLRQLSARRKIIYHLSRCHRELTAVYYLVAMLLKPDTWHLEVMMD